MGLAGVQRTLLDAHKRFYCLIGNNLDRLRASARDGGGIRHKLSTVASHLRIARRTTRQWRRETQRFLEMVRNRQQPTTEA